MQVGSSFTGEAVVTVKRLCVGGGGGGANSCTSDDHACKELIKIVTVAYATVLNASS